MNVLNFTKSFYDLFVESAIRTMPPEEIEIMNEWIIGNAPTSFIGEANVNTLRTNVGRYLRQSIDAMAVEHKRFMNSELMIAPSGEMFIPDNPDYKQE